MSGKANQHSERAFLAVEDLLAHLHPKEDTAALVRRLREHFGSAEALFRAERHVLEQLGVHASDALLLSRMPELSRCVARTQFEKFPQFTRFSDSVKYLVPLFHGLQVERFYMLCLDARGRMREQVLLEEGISDGALFSLRRILAEVVRTGANAVILSHNHPGLTRQPSQADINTTMDAIRALTAVGVPLLDHVIVAGKDVISMRQNGFVPSRLWLKQSPEHSLLRSWLEDDSSQDFA